MPEYLQSFHHWLSLYLGSPGAQATVQALVPLFQLTAFVLMSVNNLLRLWRGGD